MHILNDPSFFLKNKTRAPQVKELGLMNPLLESSCSCSDNSFILDGATRYSARAMGTAPGIKSIWNSTGRAGGRPGCQVLGKYFRKILDNWYVLYLFSFRLVLLFLGGYLRQNVLLSF
ncbi:hypothetical protein Tco_0361767 [Tanacetum coccineum]